MFGLDPPQLATYECESTTPEKQCSKLFWPTKHRIGLIARCLDFKLFAELDFNLIAEEFHPLEKSARSKISCPVQNDTLLNTISSIWSIEPRANNIPGKWKDLAKIDADIEIRPSNSRILTALSLESHSNIWAWLEEQVTKPVQHLAKVPVTAWANTQLPSLPNSWILELFNATRSLLLAHTQIVLNPQRFFPGINAQQYKAPPGRGEVTGSRILEHIEAAVISWLQFSPRPGMSLDTSRRVATLTSIAQQTFGNTDFLYLGYIQQALKRRSLVGVPWEVLAEQLKNHPLASPTSKESITLAHLKNLLWAVSGLSCPNSIPMSPNSVQMSTSYERALELGGEAGIEEFSPFFTPMYVSPSFCTQLYLTPSSVSFHQAQRDIQPLTSTASGSANNPPLLMAKHLPLSPEFRCFLSFLRAALDVTQGVTLTPVQKKINTSLDYYLPFRQLGPSKQIILGDPEGPFSPAKLRSREGFFDALIFRLVTSASPLLLTERRVCFGSSEEFNKATKDKEQSQFCKSNATGQHSRFKNIPHIDTYWEHTIGWHAYSKQTDLTLDDLLNWFIGKEGSAKRFFGMGGLAGWLLASDYANAGLVGVPDAQMVGRIIFGVDAGSRKGLELLGFDVSMQDACGESMKLAMATLNENLSPMELEQMKMDTITLEHALCKYSRLYERISKASFQFIMPYSI